MSSEKAPPAEKFGLVRSLLQEEERTYVKRRKSRKPFQHDIATQRLTSPYKPPGKTVNAKPYWCASTKYNSEESKKEGQKKSQVSAFKREDELFQSVMRYQPHRWQHADQDEGVENVVDHNDKLSSVKDGQGMRLMRRRQGVYGLDALSVIKPFSKDLTPQQRLVQDYLYAFHSRVIFSFDEQYRASRKYRAKVVAGDTENGENKDDIPLHRQRSKR